jgi:hypothetical protein
MQRSSLKPAHVLAAGALLCTSAAVARDGIILERGWAQVDYVEDGAGECRAEVKTNGKFYRIAGAGWEPGEAVYLHLENDDIRPIDYRMTVDGDGNLVQYYIPFLWSARGGTVFVDLVSASCQASLSFDWARQGV